jgi:hypothetical protein
MSEIFLSHHLVEGLFDCIVLLVNLASKPESEVVNPRGDFIYHVD